METVTAHTSKVNPHSMVNNKDNRLINLTGGLHHSPGDWSCIYRCTNSTTMAKGPHHPSRRLPRLACSGLLRLLSQPLHRRLPSLRKGRLCGNGSAGTISNHRSRFLLHACVSLRFATAILGNSLDNQTVAAVLVSTVDEGTAEIYTHLEVYRWVHFAVFCGLCGHAVHELQVYFCSKII